jgi:hypothetical protein
MRHPSRRGLPVEYVGIAWGHVIVLWLLLLLFAAAIVLIWTSRRVGSVTKIWWTVLAVFIPILGPIGAILCALIWGRPGRARSRG